MVCVEAHRVECRAVVMSIVWMQGLCCVVVGAVGVRLLLQQDRWCCGMTGVMHGSLQSDAFGSWTPVSGLRYVIVYRWWAGLTA